MLEKTRQGKRAIHQGQKEERRQAILEAAWRLFQESTYEAVTIAGIAEAMGLAKGTVFLYFKTKEVLFLTLLEQQLLSWFDAVDDDLTNLHDTQQPIPQIAALLCKQLEQRPGLTRLLAILHTLLERNIALEEALHFKYMLKEHFEHTGTLLEVCLPFLRTGQGAHVLLQCDALVIGLWHLSDATPIVRQALQNPDLRMFEVHFSQELSSAIEALLSGLEQRERLSPYKEQYKSYE